MLVGAKHKYNLVKKDCLAFMFSVQKFQHYLLSDTVYMVFYINPLKTLITKAGSLNGRLAKWSILLSCYDKRYTPVKATKDKP